MAMTHIICPSSLPLLSCIDGRFSIGPTLTRLKYGPIVREFLLFTNTPPHSSGLGASANCSLIRQKRFVNVPRAVQRCQMRTIVHRNCEKVYWSDESKNNIHSNRIYNIMENKKKNSHWVVTGVNLSICRT